MRSVSSATMARGAGRLRLLAAVLATACAMCLITAQHASAAGWPWAESATTLSLPGNVDKAGDGNPNGTSCSPTDSCVAVGGYTTPSFNSLAYVQPITDGVPGTPVAVTLPANAYVGSQDAYLQNVSCQSGNVCEAYGAYYDTGGNPAPMVVQITNGAPAPAVPITPPGDANSSEDITLNAIDCPLTGACEAAGEYQSTTTGQPEPLAVEISGGTSATAVAVALPSNHGSGFYDRGEFTDVACQATGVCAAVGNYDDNSGHFLPLEDSISNGTPAIAAEPSVPAGGTQDPSYLLRVACPRSGACEAIGSEDNGTGDGPTFALSVTGGIPGTAVTVTALGSSTGATTPIAIGGFACASASLCFAAGDYDDSGGGDRAGTITITPSGASAQSTALPSDAYTGADDDDELYSDYGNSVGCVPNGSCLAGGYYGTASNYQAYNGLMALLSPDGSITSEKAGAPSDESSTGAFGAGPFAQLDYGTACDDAGSCISPGFYYISSTVDLPYVVVEQAPLSVSTASLPGASQNAAYSQTLAAAGAWGVYSWSVSAGSLPAGLSLNAQTGVISGTPTGSGTSTFTVKVTGTGSPVPTATEQLSLVVAQTVFPKPVVRLLAASGKVSSGKLGVKLSCASATCAGTVKLEITKTVTVKKGKKKVRRHETVVLGGAHYSLAAGATKTVNVTLDGAGKKALAQAKKHRLKVTELATLTGGKQASRKETIYTATKKKKKKG
jgi:hypothetical protein